VIRGRGMEFRGDLSMEMGRVNGEEGWKGLKMEKEWKEGEVEKKVREGECNGGVCVIVLG